MNKIQALATLRTLYKKVAAEICNSDGDVEDDYALDFASQIAEAIERIEKGENPKMVMEDCGL